MAALTEALGTPLAVRPNGVQSSREGHTGLRPWRAGMVRSPERYRYPGDHAYLQGKATATIDPETVLSLLGGKQAYRRFE